MIADFLASWSLFGTTYLVGLLIAALLALVGIWVVARDHIFLGAAVAQASTLGVALGLWLGASGAAARAGWLESDAIPALLAVAASIATAWSAARAAGSGRESEESVSGWIFLVAASLPVLLMAHHPHGLEEVERLMFSTLLSATRVDLVVFGALAGATLLAVARFRDRLLLFTLDPEMAAAVGLRASLWAGVTAVWLGVVVGLSLRVSGLVYTFGCLVLPGLIAKTLCREVRPLLWVAPGLALVAALLGFVLAHRYDLPPAHTTVALLGFALAAAWAARAVRERRLAALS